MKDRINGFRWHAHWDEARYQHLICGLTVITPLLAAASAIGIHNAAVRHLTL